MLQYQVYWEGRVPKRPRRCLDYTQLQEHAASEAQKGGLTWRGNPRGPVATLNSRWSARVKCE